MIPFKGNSALAIAAISLLFAVLKTVLDATIGFSYGDSTVFARFAHDGGMLLWGGAIAWLLRRGQQLKNAKSRS